MAVKHVPMRTCIGCGEERPKASLVRLVRTPEGEIAVDPTGRRPGRGAYLCPSRECFLRARKRRAFSRAFRTEVSEAALAKLEAEWEAYLLARETETTSGASGRARAASTPKGSEETGEASSPAGAET
ncbi:MAG: YlxR family protein [Brockia lithotrophica]|nr:YlxR family protein [Brockia lithotrophica]MBT9253432.1 YlxR family protein [Brockia lithotrophica]